MNPCSFPDHSYLWTVHNSPVCLHYVFNHWEKHEYTEWLCKCVKDVLDMVSSIGLDKSQTGLSMHLFLPSSCFLSPTISVGLLSRPSSILAKFSTQMHTLPKKTFFYNLENYYKILYELLSECLSYYFVWTKC